MAQAMVSTTMHTLGSLFLSVARALLKRLGQTRHVPPAAEARVIERL